MHLTYDPAHNIAYIQLRDDVAEIETLEISDELNIDIGLNGVVSGIELLNANEQLRDYKGLGLLVSVAQSDVIEIPLNAS